MNNNNLILIILGVIFFYSPSCGSEIQINKRQTVSVNDIDTSIQFKNFISKFKIISYPFSANTECFEPDYSYSVPLVMENDSIFIEYSGPAISVGLLPDTLDYYAVIYCTAAACYLPILSVYSKSGKLLSKERISNGCGSDIGYECSESFTVYSLEKIVNTYIQQSYSYNESGDEIKGTRKKTIDTITFSIDANGIIKKSNYLSEE